MNSAHKNAKIIRRYIGFLRDAKKRSESTIRAVERSIRVFEMSTEDADFAAFNRGQAKKFAKSLTDNGASARKMYQIFNHLKAFFHWLAYQTGYKSRIDVSDIDYLSLDRKRMQEINSSKLVDWPNKEHVISLVRSIEAAPEVGKRDRALISFLLLSGMRDMAVATLPMGCFNTGTLEVFQYPDKGVATKFSKKFVSKLFVFDEELLNYVLVWADYLTSTRQFKEDGPLFPRTRVVLRSDVNEFGPVGVEPEFWKSSGPIRKILRKRSEGAGLPYFKPHAFRHAAAQLALRQCTNPEEIRAVSQNLGHENVGTTLTSYAKLTPDRIGKVLNTIDFAKEGENQFDEAFMRKLAVLAKVGERQLDKSDM